MAMVGPALPLIEQFCPTSQQIMPSEELTKMRPRFDQDSEEEPERIFTKLIKEVRMIKMNTVSAVIFSTPYFGLFFTMNFP